MNFTVKRPIRNQGRPNQRTYWNQAVERPTKERPIIGSLMIERSWDKFTSHPSEGLDPETLARIFKEAEFGNVRSQMELFEAMEEKDTHLYSQMQTRKNGVAGLEWNILSASEEAKDKEVSEFIGDILHNMEDMDDLILDVLDAIGKGYSVAEIMWQYDKGYYLPGEIKWRNPKKFKFDELDRLRIIDDEQNAEGICLPENKFIVHQYKARSGSLAKAGLLRVVSWMYIFKNFAVKDWLAFSEVYGMPIRLGKYEPGTSQADKEALMQAIRAIGADAAGVISKETEIQFIESQRSEGLLYDRLIKLCNGEMSKAILGQTLTTEVGDGGGSRALGDVQNLVRYDLLKADCRSLEKTLRRDLIRPLVLYNFGADVTPPYFKLAYERPEDLVQEANKYQILVNMGVKIPEEHIYDKFGIPVPEEGQAVVKLPEPAGGMMGGFPMKQIRAKEEPRKVDSQTATDRLSDKGVKSALSAIEESMNPLLKLVQEAKSFEGLREKIIERFQELDPNQLDELIGQALFIADLNGRAAIELEDQ